MKKYIHPKLGREAYQYIDNSECFKVADDCEKRQLAGAVFSLLELLNMGFEPVKEEVPEWIDEVIRYVSERDWIAVSNGGKEYLRKAILEHMPKQEQQKITTTDLLNLGYLELGGISGDTKYITMNAISNLLKGKGLFI